MGCETHRNPCLSVFMPCIPVLNLYVFSVPSVFNASVFLRVLRVFAVNLRLYGHAPPASTLKKSSTS